MRTVRRKKTPSRKRSKPINNAPVVNMTITPGMTYRELESYMLATYPADYKPCGSKMILLERRNLLTGEPNRYFTSCGNVPK